ncbi:MAG: rhodanese-like domain-containing protein [Elusimicrobiota bacterium]
MNALRNILLLLGLTSQPEAPDGVTVKNIDAAQAYALVTGTAAVIVLDVRTPEEFAEGRISGAVNIDFHDASFKNRLDALDKEKTYLVHCAVGGRSAKARRLMQSLRFKMIYHLEGGIKAWQKAGHAVTR